ncbi:MAG: PilC/PilY family type IV pilus protein [Lautropia sp.]|nr:PilC/PilY family type IV pilus protein [Lautropia sp.]
MKCTKQHGDQREGQADFRRRRTSKAVSSALLMMSLGLALGVAEAKIAQESLIVKDKPVVEPNLMFTLDDSGSMSFNFVPDNELAGHVFAVHPGEPKKYVYTIQGVLPTDDSTVIGMRRRSAAINTIYYNPEVRYRPWIDPTSVGVGHDGKPVFKYLPEANPEKAYVHWGYEAGGDEAGTRNITVNLKGDQAKGHFAICADKKKDGPTPSHTLGDRTPCPELAGATSIAPATYYEFSGPQEPTEADKNNRRFYKRVSIKDHASFERGAERADCKTPLPNNKFRCTQAEEYQNFANWYQYHRTRMHVAIAAVGQAFVNLPPTVRVGYGRINKDDVEKIDGVDTKVIERGVRLFKGNDRKAFFEWLNTRISSGGTPLLEATRVVGKYFERDDHNGPWSSTPGANDKKKGGRKKHLSCRRAYHLLMTDGLYNQTDQTLQGFEWDNVPGPEISRPNGTKERYQPQAPYKSARSGTLADFSMYFWNRDLRPDLPNDVDADAEDPAFWQHLSMYTMSFGVGGKLQPPRPDLPKDDPRHLGDWPALQNGTKQWPEQFADGDIETVDDLWHAAVNGRGEYLSVQDGSGFFNSVNRVLGKIVARQGSTGGVAVSSQALQTGSQKFVPSFLTGLGTGDLKSFSLNKDGSQGPLQWSAADKMPTPAVRQLFVGNGSTQGVRSASFEWGALPSVLQQDLLKSAGLNSAALGAKLVAYFRGDKADEETGTFRKRNSPLGHIVHSSPVYIGAAIDRGYQYLPAELPAGVNSGASQYRDHVRRKKAGAARPAQVFVGSNDGILHAFDAGTGVESYGYVPRAVALEMAARSKPKAQHRLMMDGPLVEGDAWWDGSWRNVLLGTTGAGPRAVFALNVTETRKGTGLNASTLLWEIDAQSQPELGHVLAAPEIGVMRDGTWVAVLGNGYESRARRAQLFVLELKSGRVLARIDTGKGSAQRANGLGGVRLIRDGNHVITGAYAGDLMGNVWKFDLASDKATDWKVAFGGKPLFTVADERPITAAPATVSHPAGGSMVLVGTGKLFDEGDNDTRDLESIYGLWDRERLGHDQDGKLVWLPGSTVIDAKAVRKREVKLVKDKGGEYASIDRAAKANQPLDWRKDRGWQIGLDMIKEQGQRNIVTPQLLSGLVLFETMSPVIEDEQALACQPSVNTPAFNLLVDPLSGRMTKSALIDTNKDGVVDGRDKVVAGWAQDDWTGRSVVLTDEPEAPCVSANCQQLARPMKSCPEGRLANHLLNVNDTSTVCVEMPGPTRWWWRELTIQDKNYGTGKAADQVQPQAGGGSN